MCYTNSIVGVDCDEVPPVPIPNTEVKLISAEDTWLEAARENRLMPALRKNHPIGWFFHIYIYIYGKTTLLGGSS